MRSHTHTHTQDGVVAGPSEWVVDNFVDAVKARRPDLSWREVVDALDHPGFELSGPEGLQLIVRAHRRGSDGGT